jgi:magnesium-transporting ATPase (P-type)
MQNEPNKGDGGFCIMIALANTAGYLMATVPPILIDPKLTHHVRYGARHYPIGWWVLLIGLLVGVSTMLTMVRIERRFRAFWNSAPLLLATILTLPFFRPEFPHGNVFGAAAFCFVLSTLAVWIRYQPLESQYASDTRIDRTARLERVKEEIQFWRGGMMTVLGTAIVATISLCVMNFEGIKRFDTDASEQVLACNYAGFATAVAFLWLLFGPKAEAAKKCNEARGLLLRIESPNYPSISEIGKHA